MAVASPRRDGKWELYVYISLQPAVSYTTKLFIEKLAGPCRDKLSSDKHSPSSILVSLFPPTMSAASRDIDPKPVDNFVEMSQGDTEKNGVLREGADYSGAVKKTSPEEIALVRKLDLRIMPTLWCMYFLNYVGSPYSLVRQVEVNI